MTKKAKMTNTVIVILLLFGVAWIASIFIHVGGKYTDNAQVTQNLVDVNARVQGFVNKVYVDEYQHVNQGDTLLVIEDAQMRLHLAQAQAALESAQSAETTMTKGVSTIRNNSSVTEAAIREVEVLLANAQADLERFQTLYEQDAVTLQQLDNVRTQYESLKAKVETMRKQKQGVALASDEQSARVSQTQAGTAVAQAAYDLAKLNLSYCVVLAPCDGYTTKKLVQQGELVMPGRKLFTIVDDTDRWITANYRETQTCDIKTGDKAEIHVDAIPNVTFLGEVERLSTATGATLSAMAPDNATGNFVKVEQRIPVKIRFTADNSPEDIRRLSAGMNATVKVKK